MEKLLLTVREAADVLSVSRSRVYELIYAEPVRQCVQEGTGAGKGRQAADRRVLAPPRPPAGPVIWSTYR